MKSSKNTPESGYITDEKQQLIKAQAGVTALPENNGFPAFSTYKIFDKRNKTVFKTKSYEEFLNKFEEMFMTSNIKKINFYGTCLSDQGYKSLGYAINNSTLIESHEIEELQNGQLIHIRTINGILINIEYLWDDMICTCKGT